MHWICILTSNKTKETDRSNTSTTHYAPIYRLPSMQPSSTNRSKANTTSTSLSSTHLISKKKKEDLNHVMLPGRFLGQKKARSPAGPPTTPRTPTPAATSRPSTTVPPLVATTTVRRSLYFFSFLVFIFPFLFSVCLLFNVKIIRDYNKFLNLEKKSD